MQNTTIKQIQLEKSKILWYQQNTTSKIKRKCKTRNNKGLGNIKLTMILILQWKKGEGRNTKK